VPKDELAQRISSRADHFMPVSLLDSQLAALVPPEDVIRVDGMAAPIALVEDICTRLAVA